MKFRLFQILINAFALLAIAGGLAAYFNAYPTIKFVNKTIINTIHVEDTTSFGKNPAPGTCLPIIVRFCQGPQIPYNYTVFPNYIGHFGQLETQTVSNPKENLSSLTNSIAGLGFLRGFGGCKMLRAGVLVPLHAVCAQVRSERVGLRD